MAVVTGSDLARGAQEANLLDKVPKGFSPTVLAADDPSGKVVEFFPQTPLTVSHRSAPEVRDIFKFYLICKTAMGNVGMARNFLNSPKSSLESIKAWFSNRKVQTKLSRINFLSITGTFNEIPREILLLTGLKILIINNTQISKIPLFFKKLTSLVSLTLKDSPIEKIPPIFNDLTSFGCLNVENCPLTRLFRRDSIYPLSLRELVLKNVGIEKLSIEVLSLPFLEYVELNGAIIKEPLKM